ncbi:hypothetical protein [Henriciella sp.]|uniref:hypothetical protein n=1 Tax=Henriciella sp. TaxID=1968823 RepID=UPI003C792BC8
MLTVIFHGAAYDAMPEPVEDAERRLNRITVTRASPFMGTLHVKLIVAPDAALAATGYENVELQFMPVIRDANGDLAPAIKAEDGRHLVTAERSTDVEQNAFKVLPTEKIIMSPGEYVLSQVSFTDRGSDKKQSYCLSSGTFKFDVRAQDVIFLGQLVLKSPPAIEATAEDHLVFQDISPIAGLKGWRRRPDNLLQMQPTQAHFTPNAIFCPDDGKEIAGW